VRNPNIIVGEYTYYDDPENAEDFERNVLYHFPFIGDRLLIGTSLKDRKSNRLHLP